LHFLEQHCALVEQGLPPSTHAAGTGFDACGIEYDGSGRMRVARISALLAPDASWLVMPAAAIGCGSPAKVGPLARMAMAKMIAASATILLMVSSLYPQSTAAGQQQLNK
jgi:hypothetical protein